MTVTQTTPRAPLNTSSKILTGMSAEQNFQAAKGINRNIMLYWDSPVPSPSICSVLEKWQSVYPAWNVRLYNSETSARFLCDKFGIEIMKLFSQCAIPAMRSDFFRVFWALSEGGIYSDVRFTPKQRPFMFDDSKNINLVVHAKKRRIRNGIFYAKKNCDEIKSIAYEIISRIIRKKSNHIYDVTGPRVWADVVGMTETNTIGVYSNLYLFDSYLDKNNFSEIRRDTEHHWSNLQKTICIFCGRKLTKKTCKCKEVCLIAPTSTSRS